MDDRNKAWLALIGAVIVFCVNAGLQVSGYQNIWVASALWGVAGLLGVYWLRLVIAQSERGKAFLGVAILCLVCALTSAGAAWIAAGRDWSVATAIFYSQQQPEFPTAPVDNSSKPKQLIAYFKTDFPNLFKTYAEVDLHGPGIDSPRISIQGYYDFQSRSSFVGYYIPMLSDTYQIAIVLADASQTTLQHFKSSLTMDTHDPADLKSTKMADLTFTGAIYVYHEVPLDLQQIASLDALYRSKGLFLQLRGKQYVMTRWLQDQASSKGKSK